MASEPFFDRGWWYIKWKVGGRWRKERLCPHEGSWSEDRKPKRPPDRARSLAQEYRDRENAARHGDATAAAVRIDLARWADRHVAQYPASHSPGSLRNVRRIFKGVVAYCAGRGVTTLDAVTPEVCRAWIEARCGQVKPQTVVTERQQLSPAWTKAVERSETPANPWKRAKVPVKRQVAPPKFWTTAELDRLFAACKGVLRDFVVVAANTGLRCKALARLEWSSVDWVRQVVKVPAPLSKSGVAYEVPMSAACNEALGRRDRARAAGSDLVFASPRTGRHYSQPALYEAIQKAARRAGIPDHGHYNHILRHSFVSNALLAGVPLAIVSKWAGHARIETTMIYHHMGDQDSQKMMERFSVGHTKEGESKE